jgi:hypothetical protein
MLKIFYIPTTSLSGHTWAAQLSQTRWTSSSCGTALSTAVRNFLNSMERWRRWSWLITLPSAMLERHEQARDAVSVVVVDASFGHAPMSATAP